MRLYGDDYEAAGVMMELLRDDAERPYFAPFVSGRPVRDDERAAYVGWLRGRGDPRGEALALAGELAASAIPNDPRGARLRELLAAIAPGWWRLVRAPGYLLNCGEARGHAAPVRFAYACPESWEALAATGEPRVRRCDRCGEDVHRCDTTTAAEAHARLGHCIAVPAALTDAFRDDDRMITGRPTPAVIRWAQALFGALPAGG